ncbi:carboxylating nicotinate-nucleotide diphosphorylase [Gemmatimonadota bacterium DH-20]|uniref:nicotinate-nucleotide diphosphorylase (carboxylating) n=1 Tax=Gaopeijia maritima TaxID=3119007 RepID=A0ABU9E931_9BACT
MLPFDLDALVARALAEDVGSGDVTTRWTVPPGMAGVAEIRAKAPVVVAGLGPARRVFEAVDPGLDLEIEVADGAARAPGERVLTVRGSLASILTAERTALNFLGRLSGVATLTRRFVEAVGGTSARVIDTRKTTPGWRELEKAAVRAGGGTNHRMGLHDMVLVKENHIAAAGGVREAIAGVRANNTRGLEVEIEVRSLDELEVALDLGVERVLLDNMSPDLLREAVQRARARSASPPLLEASGNVDLDTIADVAASGVDLISVGALTHSAPVADLSLRVVEGGGVGSPSA